MTEHHLLDLDTSAGAYGDIDDVLSGLKAARRDWRAASWRNAERGQGSIPSRHDLRKILQALVGALLPLRLGPSFVRLHNEEAFVDQTLRTALSRIYGQIRLELAYHDASHRPDRVASYSHRIEADQKSGQIINAFARRLPGSGARWTRMCAPRSRPIRRRQAWTRS